MKLDKSPFFKRIKAKHPVLGRFIDGELTNSDKILLTEKLGADKFKRVVFTVEKLKFKALKKVFPNYLKYCDKFIDRNKNNQLKKLHSTYERTKVIERANLQKELVHKEYWREENRNYHMNPNRPLEMLNYLEWNKSIHKKGLKKNAMVIMGLVTLSFVGINSFLVLIPLELFSAFINFQCVNIQNHNIYRINEDKERLEKMQLRKLQSDSEKYEAINELIADTKRKEEDVPKIEDIIAKIENKEQLEQLKKLIKRQISTNNMLERQKGMKI